MIMIGFQVSRLQPKIREGTTPAPDWIQAPTLLEGLCGRLYLLSHFYANEGGQDGHAISIITTSVAIYAGSTSQLGGKKATPSCFDHSARAKEI